MDEISIEYNTLLIYYIATLIRTVFKLGKIRIWQTKKMYWK